jgi:hypothetical protein
MSGSGTYAQFEGQWGERAQLAWDAINMKPTKGIPTWMINDMQWSHLDDLTGNPRGSYEQEPRRVYMEFTQNVVGCCGVDQYIPENPLSMKDQGYEVKEEDRSATTGSHEIILDGMVIDSPEAVVEHMEMHVFPAREKRVAELNANGDAYVQQRIDEEVATQKTFGMNMLKWPYWNSHPHFGYFQYGYENYFMAYALYPEVIERDFALQADVGEVENALFARAILEGGLPRLMRLDHDMADSRGMLADIKTLDKMWLPHFARSIKPLIDAGIRCIWHCDGNLMDLVPRLLECGLGGFQGFQYEDGMDYERICQMKTRDGDDLFIIGGVSVTTTIPHGTPQDVRDQMKWLVDNGPKQGLMLGGSSSIAPGTPIENIKALCEGLAYYREHGRG